MENASGNKQATAALYARVSTLDQDPELQLTDLRQAATQRGWTSVAEYVDRGQSGAKDSRPALDRLMADAHRGAVQTVLVWRFDRFARSTRHLLQALETFRTMRVDFVSIREAVDTSTPAGKALFTMIAAVAELERDLIRERVKAGMALAKARGRRCGRPPTEVDLETVRSLLDSGRSQRQVAMALKVPRRTLRSLLDRAGAKGVPSRGPGTPVQT